MYESCLVQATYTYRMYVWWLKEWVLEEITGTSMHVLQHVPHVLVHMYLNVWRVVCENTFCLRPPQSLQRSLVDIERTRTIHRDVPAKRLKQRQTATVKTFVYEKQVNQLFRGWLPIYFSWTIFWHSGPNRVLDIKSDVFSSLVTHSIATDLEENQDPPHKKRESLQTQIYVDLFGRPFGPVRVTSGTKWSPPRYSPSAHLFLGPRTHGLVASWCEP